MCTHRNLLAKASLIVLIAVALLVSSQSVYGQKAARLVESVDVRGNRRLTDVDILDYVTTRPGEAFNLKQIEQDLKSILAMGFFDPAQTRFSTEEGRRGGVIVVFEVVELQLIAELKFEGLRQIKEPDLIAALRERRTGIVKGAVFNVVKVRKAVRAIREFLASQGLEYATVEIRQDEVSFDSVKLTFVINEHP
jgi:outer membrane protein insertion porin family